MKKSKKVDSYNEVDQLILLLQQPDRMVKLDAIRKLGSHKSEKARDALTRLTRDQDFFVRLGAGKALGEMGDFRILAAWLGEEDYDLSYRAAESLVESGLEAIPVLVEGLKHETSWDASVWGIIVPLLEHGRSQFDEVKLKEALQPAIPILIGWIETAQVQKSSSPFGLRVSRAVDALGKIGDISALPVLENLLVRVDALLAGETIRDYVVTAPGTPWEAAGYDSSDSSINHIREAIENIKRQSS